jgi:flagellar motor switch protein FliM
LQPLPPPLPTALAASGEDDVLANTAAAALPVELEVGVPVRDFRVRHLLALEPGQVIESQWSHVEDVPIGAGNVQLAWSEFEVLDAQMAVRLTRLA